MTPDERAQIDEALIVPLSADDYRLRERAQALELVRDDPPLVRPARKAPRVPRGPKPYRLASDWIAVFGGIALAGWGLREILRVLGGM